MERDVDTEREQAEDTSVAKTRVRERIERRKIVEIPYSLHI